MNYEQLAHDAVNTHHAIQRPAELAELLFYVHVTVWPRVVLEIGCDAGGLLWAWQQLPGVERVIGVDLPGQRSASGRDLDSHGALMFRGDSHDPVTAAAVTRAVGPAGAGVVFIDGDHSYAGVCQDWCTYGPLVAPGGVVAFHDIHDPPPDPSIEVPRLWQHLTRMHAHKSIICPSGGWGGIGVLTGLR